MKYPNKHSGFTMLELMVVLSILAILLTQALPSPDSYMNDSRLRAGANDLVASMQISRAEAVGRNSAVTLCKANAGGTACVTSGGWQQGWMVFEDPDRDATVDAGEEVLQVHESLNGKITLYGTTDVEDFITFRASGQTSISSTQAMVFCDERGFGTDAKGLVVSILGRASVMPAPDTGETTCLVSGG
jgi:type IV fimbrial biogenesis protein FimT